MCMFPDHVEERFVVFDCNTSVKHFVPDFDQQNTSPNTYNLLTHIQLLHGSNVKTHMCTLSLSANFMDERLAVMLMVMYFTILINPLSPTRREPRPDPTPLEAPTPTPSCSAPPSLSSPPEGSIQHLFNVPAQSHLVT